MLSLTKDSFLWGGHRSKCKNWASVWSTKKIWKSSALNGNSLHLGCSLSALERSYHKFALRTIAKKLLRKNWCAYWQANLFFQVKTCHEKACCSYSRRKIVKENLSRKTVPGLTLGAPKSSHQGDSLLSHAETPRLERLLVNCIFTSSMANTKMNERVVKMSGTLSLTCYH